MDDVNPNAEAITAPVEQETTAPETQQEEKTEVVVPEKPSVPAERTIPYSRFQEVNKGYNDLKRRLAEIESRTKLGQVSEEDQAAIMSHPFVQELLVKQAKYELNEFTKGMLDEHPEIPEAVKKAMLANVRGFVKETTTDVESAKVDIQEYIDSYADSLGEEKPQPKTIQVASTQTKESASTARPMDIQRILDKPIDEWTDDEAQTVDKYKKSMPTR